MPVLVPLQESEIVEIEGRKYVRNSSLDRVVDSSLRVVPIYFGRIANDEQFGDDPVQGDERRAFRESKLFGPYDSEEETREVLEKEKANFGKYQKLRWKVLSRVIPEDEREALEVTRYFRNSYGVKPQEHHFWGPDIEKQFEECIEKINSTYVGILKQIERDYKDDVKEISNEGSMYKFSIKGLINGSFVHVRSLRNREGLVSEISVETFGRRDLKPTKLFPIPEDDFYSGRFFNYEIDLSREEFVSLSPLEIGADYKSVEEIVKRNKLIPGSVEFLGKR